MTDFCGFTPKNRFFLAPMAGITDAAFRTVCAEQGAAVTYTEMVSARALVYEDKKTASLLEMQPEHRPCGAQLFGNEPDIMAEAAVRAAAICKPEFLDINMGCPMPKIFNNGDGSALMKNPPLAGEIIRAVSRAVSVPVTVKFRMGWDSQHINAVEFAKIAEFSGAAAITIHGRTREAFYSGKADWEIIRQVKEAVSIPVIGNGDIVDALSAKRMLETTGCDGLMIGRAAQGNPWIFREILHYLASGELLPPPTLEERVGVALSHLDLLVALKGEHRGIQEGRKHMSWYFRGLQGGARLRDRINKISSYCEMRGLIENLPESDW